MNEDTPLVLGVCAEALPDECRVAVVPDVVGRLRELGARVVVEAGAGAAAGFADSAYVRAGADVLSRPEVFGRSGLLVGVLPPGNAAQDRLRRGQTIIGMLRPRRHPLTVRWWADHGVTAIASDLLPESLSGAIESVPPAAGTGPVDAAALQARISGHLAALTGFAHAGRALPRSVVGRRPHAVRVLVIGKGPAGRQAMATFSGLGAPPTAYSCDGISGPAARRALGREVRNHDIVVITPQELSPAAPDVLITAAAAATMTPGSVIIDTTVEPDGGSVESAVPDATVVLPPHVTVIGAGRLPSLVAREASIGYAERTAALLTGFIRRGRVTVDLTTPLHKALVVTHRGSLLDEWTQEYVLRLTETAGLP